MCRAVCFWGVLFMGLMMAACQGGVGQETAAPAATGEPSAGPMMGIGGDMMARHMAPIPQEYAGMSNPVPASEDSLIKGQALFVANCSLCHGDDGLGNGVASPVLTPQPAPVALTSQMMGDDYLFWRISEGGLMPPFNSAMPSWKAAFSADEIWDMINYIRSLSSG